MKDKFKKFWKSFKLKMSLFRIWFMKNAVVFLKTFLLVCAILVISGTITSNTPILGKIIYPIFSGIIDEINAIKEDQGTNTIVNLLAALTTVFVSVGMFTAKVKSICISDIKNDKLKLALIQANMYFNSDGKLVKRVEKVTNSDIDGDGLIAEDENSTEAAEASVSKGIFSGLKTAAQELYTIATIKVEDEEDYQDALETANLDKTAEVIAEVDAEVAENMQKKIEEKLDETEDLVLEKTLDEDDTDYEVTVKKSVIARMIESTKNFFAKIFKKYDEKPSENVNSNDELEGLIEENNDEVIVNNIETDEEKVQEENIPEVASAETTENTNSIPVVNAKQSKASEFLASLKNKRG